MAKRRTANEQSRNPAEPEVGAVGEPNLRSEVLAQITRLGGDCDSEIRRSEGAAANRRVLSSGRTKATAESATRRSAARAVAGATVEAHPSKGSGVKISPNSWKSNDTRCQGR